MLLRHNHPKTRAMILFSGAVPGHHIFWLMLLIGQLMLAGDLLAFYLSAAPFIFWIFGIIGWMSMICKSLVAAPIRAGAYAQLSV